MVRVAKLVLLAVLAGTGSRVEAEPQFSWDVPASCPTSAQLRERIEHQLGGPANDVLSAIEISIQRTSRGFVASIDLRGLTVENDVRELRARRCDALADAIAVIVARLATQARATPRAAPREPPIVELAVAHTAPSVPSMVRRHARVRIDPPASKLRTWSGGLRVLALSGIGAQPSVGFGGELAGFVGHNNLIAELAVSHWAPRVAVPSAGAGGVDVGLKIVTVRVGWTPRPSPVRIWAGAEWGSMGFGTNYEFGTEPWAAVNGGFGVAWRFSPRIHLIGLLELAVPIASTMMDGRQLYRPSPAAVRSAIGLEIPL
ncbi:MAG: hypothetical protein AB7R00_15065 [Kofleriaceae bacterium]